jgi:hypothetical protein
MSSELKAFLSIIVTVVSCIGSTIFVVIGGISHLQFPSESARIEQLRRDVLKVSDTTSEDVLGQVTEANQKVASNRAWNRIPIICILVPNGWDEVAFIEIPVKEAK